MKKAALYDQAERMYVGEHRSYEEVADAIGVSARTVRVWGEDEHWADKRARLLEQQQSLDIRLHAFAQNLMETVESDWRNGQQVDPGRLYALTRIVDRLDRAAKYRATKSAEGKDNEPAERGGLSDEILRKIEQQVNLL